MSRNWNGFPYDAADYDYSGDALAEHWARLHRGDLEPFPDEDWVQACAAGGAALEGREPAAVAAALQDAWRAYHRGDFAAAVSRGGDLGVIGSTVANKAAGIYAVYLESDEQQRLQLFQEVAERAQAAQGQMPEHANAYYLQAFALGRYSQGISVAKALAQGLGGRIKTSLDRAVALAPDHADAHTALGLYHAEIIDKVGKMVGKLTYGASASAAIDHFERAIDLFPESAIARIEYANGLAMLEGEKAWDRASELYVAAAEAQPADAMERLDVELARSELD